MRQLIYIKTSSGFAMANSESDKKKMLKRASFFYQEASNRIELLHSGFADHFLTTWIRRQIVKII